MRVNERMKKLLSIVLTLCMILSYIPAPAYAVGTDCTHHAEHTAECGYVAAVEGAPCTHSHDSAVCGYVEAVEEVLCACTETDESGALVHTEGCGYAAPVTGADCTHSHDASCGYAEAVEGKPCAYHCEICLGHDHGEEEESSSEPVEVPACYCAEKCAAETANEYCEVCGVDYTACTGTDTAAVYEAAVNVEEWCSVSGNTLTIDGTLGGKTEASEDEVDALVEAIKGYVDDGITTMIVTGSNPAMSTLWDMNIPAVSAAIYLLTEPSVNSSYYGTIDLILKEVTEIVEEEFYASYALKSITLPEVKTVDKHAFVDCDYLEKLTFGSVVTSVAQYAFVEMYASGAGFDDCDLVLSCGQQDVENNTWCGTVWKSITQSHTWNDGKCDACGADCPHTSVTDGTCDDCGYVFPLNCTHETFVDGKCNVCGITGGYCGAETNEGDEQSLIWTYDEDTGALAITGTGAMKAYSSYKDFPWYNIAEDVTSLTISEGVTEITEYAFCDFEQITNVTIPASVESLGMCAFVNCFSLKTVTFGENSSLTVIGESAFIGSKLTQITLPAAVRQIESAAFSVCRNLTDIFVEAGSSTYKAIDGVLYTIDGGTLLCYPAAKEGSDFTTPEGVTTIGNNAFELNKNLSWIILSDGVTTIGNSAFAGCMSLETLQLPDSVTQLGEHFIQGCEKLTTIELPDTLTKIDDKALHSSRLTEIDIPGSVTTIGAYAFGWCDKLTTVTIPASVTEIGDDAFYHCDALTTVHAPCSWNEKPLYTFEEDVTVEIAEHSFGEDSVCDGCGYVCTHTTFADSECVDCGFACTHESITDSKCDVCGADLVYKGEIGGTVSYYATLSEVCEAMASATAEDKAVVTLMADVHMDKVYRIRSGVFTIDLNGHSITSSDDALEVGGPVDLTIISSAAGGKIEAVLSAVVAYRGNVTVKGIKLVSTLDEDIGLTSVATFAHGGSTQNQEEKPHLTLVNVVVESTYDGVCSNYGATVEVIGGSISAPGETVSTYQSGILKLYNGVQFPLGISTRSGNYRGTLSDFLGTGMGYWVDDTLITLSDGQDSITGVVTVKCTNHIFGEDSVCDDCGAECTHEAYTNGTCDACGYVCSHETYTNGTCDACGYVCSHENFTDGICDGCGYVCPHDYFWNGKCETCGIEALTINNVYVQSAVSETLTGVCAAEVEEPDEFAAKTTQISEGLQVMIDYNILLGKLEESAIIGVTVTDDNNPDGSGYTGSNIMWVNDAADWYGKAYSLYDTTGGQQISAYYPYSKDGILHYDLAQWNYQPLYGSMAVTGTSVDLTVEQKMAKLAVNIAGLPDGQSVQAVELNGIYLTADFDGATGILTPDGDKGAISMQKNGKAWTTMLIPMDQGEVTVRVKLQSGKVYAATFQLAPAAGTAYNLTVSLGHTEALTYTPTADGSQHVASYPCCGASVTEDHSFDENNECTDCGYVCPHATFTDGKCTCGLIGGYCGAETNEGGEKSVYWTYDKTTYAFAVTGTGAMKDYGSYSDRPWNNVGHVTSLTVGEGVNRIGNVVFYDFSLIEEVTIPASVESIGANAFTTCDKLKVVTFAEDSRLTYIEEYAFSESALKEITLPASVTSIAKNIFSNCWDLTDIYVDDGNTAYKGVDGVLYSADRTTLVYYPMAKEGTEFVTPAGVTTIAAYAFFNNPNLEIIRLPEGVTTIESNAFGSCDVLHTLHLPDSVTTLGACFIMSCNNLTSIELPDALTKIDNGAFAGSALTEVNIPKNVTIIGDEAFTFCSRLTNVVIPEGVTTIGKRALSECTSLSTVTIPASVTEIGTKAFDRCSALTNVNATCKWDGSLYTFGSGVTVNKVHTEEPTYTPTADGSQHIASYACCNTTATEEHTTNREATCQNKAVCDLCGEYGETAVHEMDPATGYCKYACGEHMAQAKVVDRQNTANVVYVESMAAAMTEAAKDSYASDADVYALANSDETFVIPKSAFFHGGEYTFSGTVTNNGYIYSGTFTEDAEVTSDCAIYGGTFNGKVTNDGYICGGVFNGDVTSRYMISNAGHVPNPIFNGKVTNESDGIIYGGNFEKTSEIINSGLILSFGSNGNTYIDGKLTNMTGGEISDHSTSVTVGPNFQYVDAGGKVTGTHNTTVAATCQNKAVCSVCGEYGEVDPDAHTGNNSVVGKVEPTCGVDGYTGDTVCECGVTIAQGEVDPATGNHNYATEVEGSRTPATCMAEGSVTMKCGCGATEVQTLPIDKNNHTGNTHIENKAEPTCGADGYTGDTVCECGVTIAQGAADPATGNHNYVTEVEGTRTPATCMAEGSVTMKCGCGATEVQTLPIDKDNHTGNTHIEGKVDPTCGADGYTGDTVCECGVTIAQGAADPATGNHNYVTEVEGTRTSATCMAEGSVTMKCGCGATEVQTLPIDKNNHTGNTHIENKVEPTCGADGYTGDTVCECGVTITKGQVDPATGDHNYATEVEGTRTPATCMAEGSVTMACGCGATEVQTLPIDKNNHTGNTHIEGKVDPTCGADGYTGDTVCECGVTIAQGEVDPATGNHNYVTEVEGTRTPATCMAEGSVTMACGCGAEEVQTLPIDKDNHTGNTHIENKVEPTCGVDGYTGDTVCECGVTIVQGEVDPATGDHNYATEVEGTRTPATCMAEGSVTMACGCGAEDVQTLPIDKDNHTGNTTVKDAVEPTCGADGYTGDTVCECGVTIAKGQVDPATGNHNYATEVEGSRIPATCMKAGSVTMKCGCGAEDVQTLPIDKDNHTGSNSVVGKVDPTCGADGYTGDTVCECGVTIAQGAVDPATGKHSWSDWTVTQNPTTTAEGVKERSCSGCGDVETDNIPKLNEVTMPESNGGDVVVDNETPATGDEVTITVTPDSGMKVDKIVVKDEEGNEIPVKDNGDGTYTYEQPAGNVTIEVTFAKKESTSKPNWMSWLDKFFGWGQKCEHAYATKVVAPTCDCKGYTVYTCSKCGDSYKDNYTNALGHAWDAGKITKEATCTENGVKTFTCGNCGKTKTETIKATGHNYQDGICNNCGKEEATTPDNPNKPSKPGKPGFGSFWDWISGWWN